MGLNLPDVSWVIARDKGLDGTSILHHNAVGLLNSQGKRVQTATGEEIGDLEPFNETQESTIIVPELSFRHPVSKRLYLDSFVNSDLSREEWLHEHSQHTKRIEDGLESIIQSHTPIFLHNLVSLREYHPQAAIALKHLIEKNEEVPFISYAPDSTYERPERTSRMKPFVLDEIASYDVLQSYDTREQKPIRNLGPYNYPNLYHLVVNKEQEKTFINEFGLEKDHVFRIHDFLPMESKIPPEIKIPDSSFVDYLSKHGTILENGELKHYAVDIGDYPTFFLQAVRPIERKKIKTAIYVAYLYSKKTKRKTPVVITHKTGDEGGTYLKECVALGNTLDVPVIYLGDSMKPISAPSKQQGYSLWDVYENMAGLNTIGMVLSSKGAWENTINEGIKYQIPEYVNPQLSSYQELKEMGIDVQGGDLRDIDTLVSGTSAKELKNSSFYFPQITTIISWIEQMANEKRRHDLVSKNYEQAYKHLSTEAVTSRFMNVLQNVY